MPPLDRRRITASLLLFALLLTTLGWPWPTVQRWFSRVHATAANAVIGQWSFGTGGQATLAPRPALTKAAGDNVVADSAVLLSVAGYAGQVELGMNVRRDVWLPLVILTSIIIAAPLTWRRRVRCFALGYPVLMAAALAALWLLIAHTFARQMRGVYTLGTVSGTLLDLGFLGLLAPPSNRFVAPVLLGAALVYWQYRRAGT